MQSMYLIKCYRQDLSFNFKRGNGFKDREPSILLLWEEARKMLL